MTPRVTFILKKATSTARLHKTLAQKSGITLGFFIESQVFPDFEGESSRVLLDLASAESEKSSRETLSEK